MAGGTKWELDSEGHPLPRNGGYFAMFKDKGQKTFSANVVLPDGHKEKWDSRESVRPKAIGATRSYVRGLCKQRNVPTLLEQRIKRGEISAHKKTKANNEARAAGLPLPYPPRRGGGSVAQPEEVKPRRGRPPGSKNGVNGHTALARGPMPLVPIIAPSEDDISREWPGFQARYAEKCVILVTRVTELLILGGGNDPETFLTNVKALLVDSIEGSIRRPRGRPPAGP